MRLSKENPPLGTTPTIDFGSTGFEFKPTKAATAAAPAPAPRPCAAALIASVKKSFLGSV
jgi:hypothetical protein